MIYKETILPEYGIPNPKISSRINKRLMKRKFIATIFMMLETFSVANFSGKTRKRINMQTFVVISNRLIQTYFFSGHPLFHRSNDTVLFTSNKLSLFKSRYVGFNLQVNVAIKAYQTINKLTPRKVNLSDRFPEGGKKVWTLTNNWIYIMNRHMPHQ